MLSKLQGLETGIRVGGVEAGGPWPPLAPALAPPGPSPGPPWPQPWPGPPGPRDDEKIVGYPMKSDENRRILPPPLESRIFKPHRLPPSNLTNNHLGK